MGEQKSDCILLKAFAGIFVLLGCVILPGCFLLNFQKQYFPCKSLTWLLFIGSIIGVTIFIACCSLNRMLFNNDSISKQYLLPEIRIFSQIVAGIYCGFAFIVPILLKIGFPSMSILQGISIVLFVHAVGLVPGVFFNIVSK